jgi:Ca2+-binding EF-hand superfamily protein
MNHNNPHQPQAQSIPNPYLGESTQQGPQKTQPDVYQFNLQYIDQFANLIFMRHDQDLSGKLEMNEFPGMMEGFFKRLGVPPPSKEDSLLVMQAFDSNQDGKIGFREFRAMLYYLGGHGR